MQALRVKDVAPLLHDYQRLKPLGLARAAAEQGPGEGDPLPWQAIAEGTELTARYSHFKAENLRVGDVGNLQLEYNTLSASQHGSNGVNRQV